MTILVSEDFSLVKNYGVIITWYQVLRHEALISDASNSTPTIFRFNGILQEKEHGYQSPNMARLILETLRFIGAAKS